MPYRNPITISLLLIIIVLPRLGETVDWSGTKEVKDGVRHVLNPAESMFGSAVYEPKELFRLGGFSESEKELFGVINHILVDEQDKVYILDLQLSEVRVFNINGEYVRTVGREGEGPGEFRYPTDMLFLPDGKLGVIQPSASRIVLFEEEGTPAGGLRIQPPEGKGFFRLAGGRLAGDQLVMLYELGNKNKGSWNTTHHLAFFDMTGKQRNVLIKAATKMNYLSARFDEGNWNRFNRCWTVSPDGRVFARADLTEYKIHVWRPDGELDRIIHREYPPHRRSKEEIEEIKERWTRRFRWLPNLNFDIEENWAPVHDLYAQRDGTLWARTSRGWRGGEEGVMASFDVFDSEGRFVQEISFRGEFDAENDALFLEDEYMIVVTDLVSAMNALKNIGDEEEALEEEPEPMTVICYRLPLDIISARSGQATKGSSR
jgi:hypothetical protein